MIQFVLAMFFFKPYSSCKKTNKMTRQQGLSIITHESSLQETKKKNLKEHNSDR